MRRSPSAVAEGLFETFGEPPTLEGRASVVSLLEVVQLIRSALSR